MNFWPRFINGVQLAWLPFAAAGASFAFGSCTFQGLTGTFPQGKHIRTSVFGLVTRPSNGFEPYVTCRLGQWLLPKVPVKEGAKARKFPPRHRWSPFWGIDPRNPGDSGF